MRKTTAGMLGLVMAAGMGTVGSWPTQAAPAPPTKNPAAATPTASDDQVSQAEAKRQALRQQAVQDVINGDATPVKRGGSTVVKVSKKTAPTAVNRRGAVQQKAATEDQYVELSRDKTDRIFVVLAEFGNKRDPRFPDKDIEPSTPGPVTWDGPVHNKIPKPAADDNSTIWQADYSPAHFRDLYFGTGDEPGSGGKTESLKQYYERQSSGRYSVDGTVTNWVKVPYNEARYGRSSDNPATNGDDPNVCGDVVCSTSEDLVRDGVNQWYADQIASGRSKASVVAELKTFDQWDRTDVDADGNFNEPDGYIDHFQIVHAGGDEANGDPTQGEDAIWSHRGFAYQSGEGVTGPATAKLGGTQIGDSGLWVGDYTMQPENGGMSVFAHEYGHDLGLPDLYDTAGGANSVYWWSLMAQNRLSAPGESGIGARAGDMGAWEKLQLGWLDYDIVTPQQNRTLELGPHEYNTAKSQAAVVVLPKQPHTTTLAKPYAGQRTWWSGTGNDYKASMTRSGTLPANASLAFQANYNIEEGYDYAYVEINDGSGWVSVPGNKTNPEFNNGLTGDSGGAWVPLTYDLSSYSGKKVQMRLRYRTDGGVAGNGTGTAPGIFADAIAIKSGTRTVFTDGAETSPNGWTLDKFSSVGSSISGNYDNYYIASNRTYTSFDKYLQSGPYNFGFYASPDKVEHFPYQNGLLVSYWDTFREDNNTSEHPGSGLILPVDANPSAIPRLDGGYFSPAFGAYDATFGLEKSDSITLHRPIGPGKADQANYIRGQAAQPLFHDDKSYYDSQQPGASVQVPNSGTDIEVLSQSGTSMSIKVSKR